MKSHVSGTEQIGNMSQLNVSVLFQDLTYRGYHHLLTLDKLHMQYNRKRTGSM
jgi:hypothetical protein